jgi:hypothetical protein
MITDIIRIIFLKLNKDKIPATPDMYRKYFYKEARRLGVYHSEYNSINSLLDTLSYRNRQIIKKLKINSMEDLLKFLIVQLENASKVTNEDKENKKDGAVARLENNKFLIVLLESDLDKVANNISDILFKEHFEYNKTKIRFTVSGAINTRTNYKSQDIMLKEIENILQNAKHNGRNRIEMR